MNIEKYINGFENGWFSSENTINWNPRISLKALSCVPNGSLIYMPRSNFMHVVEDIKIIFKFGRVEVKLCKNISFSKFLKKNFGFKCKELDIEEKEIEKHNYKRHMWFAIFGSGKNECVASKGDGSILLKKI